MLASEPLVVADVRRTICDVEHPLQCVICNVFILHNNYVYLYGVRNLSGLRLFLLFILRRFIRKIRHARGLLTNFVRKNFSACVMCFFTALSLISNSAATSYIFPIHITCRKHLSGAGCKVHPWLPLSFHTLIMMVIDNCIISHQQTKLHNGLSQPSYENSHSMNFFTVVEDNPSYCREDWMNSASRRIRKSRRQHPAHLLIAYDAGARKYALA